MTHYKMSKTKQLELLEGGIELETKIKPAKRVDIVRLKLIKEKSLLYKNRFIRSPEDGYKLTKTISR